MKKKKGLFTRLPFFALIFSVYPSLALLSTNIREVEWSVVLRPLLFSLVGTAGLVILFQRFLKDWTGASFATSAFLIFFFSYGHITRIMTDRLDPDLYAIILITVYLIFFALLILVWRWIARRDASIHTWTAAANIVALVLVLFPALQIIGFVAKGSPAAVVAPSAPTPLLNASAGTNQGATTPNPEPNSGNPNEYPDVYLIVLDGYSRADTLEVLGYDNTEFLNSLEERGFYVAECSRSNYRHTLLSMSSMFGMDLIWRAIPNSGPTDDNTAPLYEMLIHNPVRSDFEQKGYTTVAFKTGYQWDQWIDADHYLVETADSKTGNAPVTPVITPFEYLFLKNTALQPLIENSSLAGQRYYAHYQHVNFILDQLPRISTSIPGPKFVYAHIMSPHTPYIFLPDGSLNTDSRFYNTETGTPSNPELQAEGYINNIRYLNFRILDILDKIKRDSKIPPIIILMGDHGYVLEERRFNNLMAFHFPNGGNDSLYPTITPVNTFRLISNLYFGTDMELRNDVSNESDIGHPYLQKRAQPFPETCP